MYTSLDDDKRHGLDGLQRLARLDSPAQRHPNRRVEDNAYAGPRQLPGFTIWQALDWLKRGAGWVVLFLITGAVVGLAFSSLAAPRFTASVDILVDPSNLQVVPDDLYRSSQQRDGQLLDVESKRRVLTSGNVLARVVASLGLDKDPEFLNSAGLLGLPALPSLAGTDSGTATRDPTLIAMEALDARVRARREERSYIVSLSVWSGDPDKSVRIADAFVDAFKTELAQAESDGADRTAASLIDGLDELKASVTEAEGLVEAFKRQHGLQSSSGELVSTQSMTQLNTQVLQAQQALNESEAAYLQLANSGTGAANADAVQSPTMVALRTQYGLLKQQVDADSMTYGPRHPTLLAALRQLAGLEREIAMEARRAVQSARTTYEQARTALDALTEQSASAQSTVFTDSEARVQLRELERDAAAKAAIYESSLTRARQVAERSRLDSTNIRVISAATPPKARNWPPRAVVSAGGGAAGGAMLGAMLALGLGLRGEFRRQARA